MLFVLLLYNYVHDLNIINLKSLYFTTNNFSKNIKMNYYIILWLVLLY